MTASGSRLWALARVLARGGVLAALCIGAVSAQGPDRSKPPAVGPAPGLTLPAIQRLKTSGGVPVWLIEQHEVPLAQVNLIVRAGASADRAGRFGLASLTAAMLDEGAGTRSALELADAFEFLGADIGTASSFDYSAVRLGVPVKALDQALPLLADVALRPSFPPGELERLRKERLTSLMQARDNPSALVNYAFPRLVFGPAHRYGTPAGGLAPVLEALGVDDVKAFYRESFAGSEAAVAVVGDVTAAAVMPMIDRALGAWRNDASRGAMAPVPAAPQLTRRQVFIVDKPGAAQSQIRIGWVGVPRSTADYATLQVLNTILGGSFTSRLNQNLREKNGFSYGASSTFDMRLSAGPFYATAGVQTDKTADAVREFFAELNGILKPVPETELEKAKNYVALGFPAEFETTRDFAQKLEELIVYGLPEDTYRNFVGAVMKVTAADVQKAAARYIQPDRMAVVIVGDRKAIEPGVSALNLGPLRVVPIDEFMR
jgi:predicted Zn-dependent peptidase